LRNIKVSIKYTEWGHFRQKNIKKSISDKKLKKKPKNQIFLKKIRQNIKKKSKKSNKKLKLSSKSS